MVAGMAAKRSNATTGTARDDEFDFVDLDDVDDFDDFLAEQSKDPEFARGLEDAEQRGESLRQLIAWRKACGLTQATAASMMGTTQSAVSELEGGATEPALATLQRYARSIGARVVVTLVPPDDCHFVDPWTMGGVQVRATKAATFSDPWSKFDAEHVADAAGIYAVHRR